MSDMGELLLFLIGLALFALVWAATGHLLWAMGAAVLRALSGSPAAPPPPRQAALTCRGCGAVNSIVQGKCDHCGYVEPRAAEQSLAEDIQATLRHINRFWRRGLLSDADHEKLKKACERDLDRLTGRIPPLSSPAPQPVAAPQPRPTPQPRPVAQPARRDIEFITAEVVTAEIVEPAAPLHPLDRPEEVVVAAPPQPPRARRALADVLTAFMQERNIRWGELVSGLLIVGSAAGLVLSLRATLSNWIPYFPALLFLLGTAAIHGAGLYTLSRWNLRSTSRGVLLISMLLVPLCILAAILTSAEGDKQLSVTNPIYIAAITIGLLSYGAISYTGARALLGSAWPPLALAVLGPSAAQLAIHRLVSPTPTSWQTLALGAIPAGCFVVAVLAALARGRRWSNLSLKRAQHILYPLALGSFALVLPLALMVSYAEVRWTVLGQLGPILALVFATILAAGLFIAQRTTAKSLAALATSGTALAVFGALGMLASVFLAWPQPAELVIVGVLSGVALIGLAIAGRLALLHVPAIACLALASLVGFHLWQGSYSGYERQLSLRLVETWSWGRSAVVLSVLAGLATAVAGGLWQRKLRWDAIYFLASAGGLVVLGALIAAYDGFWGGVDAELATPLFAVYALAVAAATWIVPQRYLTWSAAVLSLVAAVHGLDFNPAVESFLQAHEWMPERPALLAVLMHANILAALALAGWWFVRDERRQSEVIQPLSLAAAVGASLALPFAVIVTRQYFDHHVAYTLAIAAVWSVAAIILRTMPHWRSAAQAIASLSIVYAVTAVCQRQEWWEQTPLLDARWLYSCVAALGAWCIVWSIIRRTLRWTLPIVDQVLLVGLVGVLLFVPAFALFRPVALELGLRVMSPHPAYANLFVTAGGAWIALGFTAAALVAAFWERSSLAALFGFFILAISPCLLVALAASDQLASASMLRWSLAGYAIVGTVVFCLRQSIGRAIAAVPGLLRRELPAEGAYAILATIVGAGILPIVGLTLVACQLAATGVAPGGPVAESLFAKMGWSYSYGTPLVVLVGICLALGLRERQAGFVLGGSLIWQFVVTLAAVMPTLTSGGSFTTELWIQVLQYNAIGLAAYMLLWLGMEPWLSRTSATAAETSTDVPQLLLALQMGVMLLAVLGLSAWSGLWVIRVGPDSMATATLPLGSWHSLVTLGLAAAAAVWFVVRHARAELATVTAILLLAAVPLVAAACQPLDATYPWTSLHVLLGGWLVVAALLAGAVCWLGERGAQLTPEQMALRKWAFSSRRQLVVWATLPVCGVLCLLLVFGWSDPLPWFPVAATVVAGLTFAALAFFARLTAYAYLTVPISMLAVTQAIARYAPSLRVEEFLALNMLAGTVTLAAWLAVEIWRERTNAVGAAANWVPPPPFTLTPVLTVAYAGLIALESLFEFALPGDVQLTCPANIVAALAIGGYLLANLWYDRQRLALPCLFLWALATALLPCERLAMERTQLIVFASLAFAIVVALAGVLWQAGARIALVGQRLGIHDPVAGLERTSRWLPPVTLLLSAGITLFGLNVVLQFEPRSVRIAAGFAPVLLAIGTAMQAQQQRRALMQYVSLLLASVAAVYLGWADIEPGNEAAVWLERTIRLLVVLGGLAIIYGAILPRVLSNWGDWLAALEQMALTCAGGAGVTLLAILALDVAQFQPGRDAALATVQVLVVAVVLVLLAAALVSIALRPRLVQQTAWLQSDMGRMGCVYAAQIVLALAFGHLYLTRPTWFDSALRPYWPYIIMAIAFVGVGIGEWLRRVNVNVLAQPLQNTGAFLPLIPAIGWWIESLRGEPTTEYATVMFGVGMLYVVLSVCRQSFASAIAAALAGNVALWSLMSEKGFALVEHPQFWLIPPAVSVLVALQIHRRRLSEAQLTAGRYVSMLVIYISSTSEIFIAGIGESPWPPLTLVALSVIGVFTGIAFQVRAFLYLGTSFAFLSMITLVWHTARWQEQIWPWWAFGICMGLAMLTFFGIFEKKRPEITALVERLRKWEH